MSKRVGAVLPKIRAANCLEVGGCVLATLPVPLRGVLPCTRVCAVEMALPSSSDPEMDAMRPLVDAYANLIVAGGGR